jgi:TRAP-type C4-dicarboxylate transport system permease small subunit
MEAFDKAVGRVSTALAYLACAVIPCMFTMIVIDVSMRTVGISPPLFTSSVVEYALLYVAMFSAPWLVREKGHVAIEALLTIIPPIVSSVWIY